MAAAKSGKSWSQPSVGFTCVSTAISTPAAPARTAPTIHVHAITRSVPGRDGSSSAVLSSVTCAAVIPRSFSSDPNDDSVFPNDHSPSHSTTFSVIASRGGHVAGFAAERRLIIAAGLFFAGDLAVWHWSIVLTSVANATLLANLAPIFVTLAGWLFWKRSVTRTFLAGMTIAIVGMFVLVGPNFSAGGTRLHDAPSSVATRTTAASAPTTNRIRIIYGFSRARASDPVSGLPSRP